jgi:hypothetical protein
MRVPTTARVARSGAPGAWHLLDGTSLERTLCGNRINPHEVASPFPAPVEGELELDAERRAEGPVCRSCMRELQVSLGFLERVLEVLDGIDRAARP